jgi:hypothetical protein
MCGTLIAIGECPGPGVIAGTRAVKLPFYSHTAAVTGSVILLAACVAVVITLLVGWWRQR